MIHKPGQTWARNMAVSPTEGTPHREAELSPPPLRVPALWSVRGSTIPSGGRSAAAAKGWPTEDTG